MTNVQLARQLVTAPRRFFTELAETPRYALPMWAIVLTTLVLIFWFYSIANIEWLIEQQLNSNPRTAAMSEAERAQAMRFMTRGMMTSIAVGGGLFIIVAFRLIEAAYYALVGRLTGHRRTFRQWFAFSWWTTAPALIGVVPALLLLAMSTGSPTDVGLLQPLSLNELFFHRRIGEPGFQLFSNVSILTIVTLGLTVYGQKCWSGRSWLYSAVVVLTVPVLIGGWALTTVLK
ncbi:MAG: YIP1 family protein [Steroidobacteraceae bacterium]